MNGDGSLTLLLSVGGVATGPLVLLRAQVVGPFAGEAVTSLTRMLEAAASFYGTSTSLDMNSAALLQGPDIHSKVILYVASSSDQWFTLLLACFPLRNF